MRLTKQDVTKKPEVVTICGSTRFIDELNYWRKGLAEFSSGLWTPSGEPAGSGYSLSDAGKEYAHAEALKAEGE